MTDKIIFLLDIDGTLLDNNYQSTEPRLISLITKLNRQGHIFALNSNRSLEDLLPVAKQFGIKGQIVGENGCFIYNPELNKTRVLLKKSEISLVIKARKKIKEKTLEFFQNRYPKDGILWTDTDTVAQISKNNPKNYIKQSYILKNNKYRKYTMSTHLRKIINNSYQLCPDVMHELVYYLNKQITLNGITITSSTVFNNFLMYPSSVSKRSGVEQLLIHYPKYLLKVIGDEMGDYRMSEGLGSFYAVANADEITKKYSEYVSPHLQTKGVYDIIHKIIDQNH